MGQNCYAYATKYVCEEALDPGVLGGLKYSDTNPKELQRAAEDDGLTFLSDVQHSLPYGYGEYPFIVAGLSASGNPDAYHWIRRDSNGIWSHKFGDGSIFSMEVSDVDAGDKKLTDSNHAGVADFDYGTSFKNSQRGKLVQENDQSGWATKYDRFVGWFGCTEQFGIFFCKRITDQLNFF